MITSITRIEDHKISDCAFHKPSEHRIDIGHSLAEGTIFTLKIIFDTDIISFRHHDYTWKKVEGTLLSNWYAPKIIRLKNGQIVQANQLKGIWEVRKSDPKVLLWHFNPIHSKPLVNYDSQNNKLIAQASHDTFDAISLLFPNNSGMEVSRSKYPFSGILCFTDHCDFDTRESLRQQRHFFKRHDIRITKGFFLNHFSKRTVTASFEGHSEEFDKWRADGHELAYHSLSQSLKPYEEGIDEFINFTPPYTDVVTWIDHGFQPYNMSLYKNQAALSEGYGKLLYQKSIQNYWNYTDSGTAVKGVINQIDPNQFTLNAFYKGLQHLDFKSRCQQLVKAMMFHYYGTNESIGVYRDLAKYLKSVRRRKSLKKHFSIFTPLLRMIRLIIPIVFFWKMKSRQVYPMASYGPVMFTHHIDEHAFNVFQTIELIDLKAGLCQENIDLLAKQSGICIAHTYFSAPFNYHKGKLFGTELTIDSQVEANFRYLSQHIQSKTIWNPTLKELVAYLKLLKTVRFDCDDLGNLILTNPEPIEFREVL